MSDNVYRSASNLASQPIGSYDANPKGSGFFALVHEDFETHGRDWVSDGFWTLFWHRFGNWRMSVKPRLLRAPFSVVYKVAYRLSKWATGIDLPYTVEVGRRVRLDHFCGMILVAKSIGDETVIRQNTTFGIAKTSDTSARPVLGAIHVGDNATIGANSVVVTDVPAGATVVGAPARPIKKRDAIHKPELSVRKQA
jgi:serine O-acetyltransferase